MFLFLAYNLRLYKKIPKKVTKVTKVTLKLHFSDNTFFLKFSSYLKIVFL